MISEILDEAILRMDDSVDHYKRQFSTVRTGRASAGLVDGIKVDYYGTLTPLKQVAKISIPESSLIVIQPWDASIISIIERAILKSDLGLMPSSDGKIIRINIPPLTEERRKQLVKLIKKMTEEGRVALRNIRRDSNDAIKAALKDKSITEDEAHEGYDNIQEKTDEYIKKMDEIGSKKEEEIMEG